MLVQKVMQGWQVLKRAWKALSDLIRGERRPSSCISFRRMKFSIEVLEQCS